MDQKSAKDTEILLQYFGISVTLKYPENSFIRKHSFPRNKQAFTVYFSRQTILKRKGYKDTMPSFYFLNIMFYIV